MYFFLKRLLGYLWPKVRFVRASYAQEGDDLVIASLLRNIDRGFYVDVGAHHPIRFSNTYKLYERGWTGINIDATPGSMDAFKKLRSRDINVEAAISDVESELIFYEFDEPALNGFASDLMAERASEGRYSIRKKIAMTTVTLDAVLTERCCHERGIDLITIDVEGFDLEVLRSIDLDFWRPKLIVIETKLDSLVDLAESDVFRYLRPHGYKCVAHTGRNTFYILD
jgi:FkbM family methyltransferase